MKKTTFAQALLAGSFLAAGSALASPHPADVASSAAPAAGTAANVLLADRGEGFREAVERLRELREQLREQIQERVNDLSDQFDDHGDDRFDDIGDRFDDRPDDPRDDHDGDRGDDPGDDGAV